MQKGLASANEIFELISLLLRFGGQKLLYSKLFLESLFLSNCSMLNRKKIDLTKYQIGEQAIQTIHKMQILFEKLFLDWELFCYMFLVISAFCSNS